MFTSAAANCGKQCSRSLRVAAAMAAVGALVAVSGASRSAAAQNGDDSTDAYAAGNEASVASVWGAAPSWPFQGVVAHVGYDGGYKPEVVFRPSLEAGTVGLGFRNSVTGEVSYVQAAGDPWFCNGGVMHVDRDGVVWDYGEYDSDRRWTVWVPWGDLGYPLFVRPRGASWDLEDLSRHVWPSRRGDRVQFGSGVADLSLTVAGDEVLGVGTPGGSSFYLVSSRPIEDRFGSGDWTGGLPGFVIDEYFAAREAAGSAGLAPEEYFTFDDGAGPESWPWWPESVPEGFFAADDPNNLGRFGVVFAGTDGQYYGLTIRFDEPACGGNLTYVVDAVSGEIATCGWSWVGPLLVAPVDAVDPSFVPVLPELSMGDDHRGRCSRVLDLRDWDSYLEQSGD